jgi:carboxypeptidase Taq
LETALKELKDRLAEISHLRSALALLEWDQATHCPNEGHEARASQLAVLGQIAQEKATDLRVGQLLDKIEPHVSRLPETDVTRNLIDVVRRDYERERLVDPRFKAEMTAHFAQTYNIWTKAKSEDNWEAVKPYLQKTLDYTRRYSDLFVNKPSAIGLKSVEHPMDPLISLYDFGQKTTSIKSLFLELRSFLVPFANRVLEHFKADDSCLYGHFPLPEQKSLNRLLAEAIGYDLNKGRIDTTHHPFATHIGPGDVRITTRYMEKYLGESISSTIHECGHGMYEQGIGSQWKLTPLDSGVSSGVHESQSRLWENIVGRSAEFWSYFYPEVQKLFPQFRHIPLQTFVQAMNKVKKSLIRVDADEVTYNLHVMIRFDLECALMEGKLSIDKLPSAWNERYHSDLGLEPPRISLGVMQDVHWYSTFIGGCFQGYTIGNIFSAQIFDAACKDLPDTRQSIAKGDFKPLRQWLTDKLYCHGRRWSPDQMIENATGMPLTIDPYCHYLRDKYEKLAGTSLGL